jgi:ABC-2 type transport system ATP-binding protein
MSATDPAVDAAPSGPVSSGPPGQRPAPGPNGAPTDGRGGPGKLMVRTTALTKRYGSLTAVDRLELAVPEGAVFGLVGPNGAGKTTTFAVLASLLVPTSGSALVAGVDPVASPRELRRRVGYMPDVLGVYDGVQVGEYLRFFAAAYGIGRRDQTALVPALLDLVDLKVKQDAMVNSLSRGMKQRLSLARALVHEPEVLILDEPASGLDPRARIELRELIGELRTMGKTVIISSHILSELEEMCTDIAILEAGTLLAQGRPGEILGALEGGRTVAVRFADGTEERMAITADEDQADLLHRLVAVEGRRVVEFREVGGSLEEVFMKITKGVVQ